MERLVTVIIPSYKRAHLLERTIPTYWQDGVKEIILVDDCSPDNTEEVVRRLQKTIPALVYYRQPRNKKQTAAKNQGLRMAGSEWIYFGDDDSILTPDSIRMLYETATATGAKIVGARALYMNRGEDKTDLNEVIRNNTVYARRIEEIVNIRNFSAHFNLAYAEVAEVPFCQACMLAHAEMAKNVMFDEGYVGNAYREETDFIIRCSKAGAKVVYDSRAIQYNLPAELSTGGARGSSVWRYKWNCIRNNWRFLKKNWSFIQEKYGIDRSALSMQIEFAGGYVVRPLKRLIKSGRLKK